MTQITLQDGKAIAIRADVSKAIEVKRLFEETERAFGSPNVLVNNAGVFKFEPLEAITEEEFHREFDTNVLGQILAIQEALKHFPASGGSIINISSIASENPVPNSSPYRGDQGCGGLPRDGSGQELGRGTSGLMSSPRVWLIPKATEIAGSSTVKREMLEHRRLRSARDLANRRKSRRSSFFSRRMVRRG